MQSVPKGVHKVKRRLSSGGESVHYYAWRGGPKMLSKPGTPEFAAEFASLTVNRHEVDHHDGTFQQLINAFQASHHFKHKLKPTTKAGYTRRIRAIERVFGDLPIEALNDHRIRKEFLSWRDRVAKVSGTREADYRMSVLARIISWALNNGDIRANHVLRPGRLHSGSRADKIWRDADIALFRQVAKPHVELPFALGLETGQREGDILSLTWDHYDGAHIRLKQSKTGKKVVVKVLADMRKRLDALKSVQKGPFICQNSKGRRWTIDGYKTSFGKAKARAKSIALEQERARARTEENRMLTPQEESEVFNLTFHDTRGTAVVILARAGSTVAEIASVTGHSLHDAEHILSASYLSTDQTLSDSAMAKVEAYLKRN